MGMKQSELNWLIPSPVESDSWYEALAKKVKNHRCHMRVGRSSPPGWSR